MIKALRVLTLTLSVFLCLGCGSQANEYGHGNSRTVRSDVSVVEPTGWNSQGFPVADGRYSGLDDGRVVVVDEMLSARRKHRRVAGRSSVTLAGVVAPLAAKVREIVNQCGSHVVSAVRSSGMTPNHRQGKAVDVQGNPSCIYSLLKGWPGGYSTDYATAPGTPHVHISYSRAHEWGLRFTHRHGGAEYADAGNSYDGGGRRGRKHRTAGAGLGGASFQDRFTAH